MGKLRFRRVNNSKSSSLVRFDLKSDSISL